MNLKLGWMLLLFLSAAVRSVPIDRSEAHQEQKEEVQEENMVGLRNVAVKRAVRVLFVT